MTLVPVNLKSWMNLTDTPEDVQKEITNLMQADLAGGSKTGFMPYIKDNQIIYGRNRIGCGWKPV